MLRAGRLHPRYGLADTGRTTCSKPNVQNLPGDGPVREAIQPAPGYAFLERDYSGIELCSFAAVAARELDDWSMADTINQSGDPGYLHAVVGGMLLGCSAEELLRRRKAGDELAENARTRGKNANFGFIGGLGHRSYVDYIRLLSKGKLILTEAESKAIKDAWAAAVPAGPRYLRWVGTTERMDGTYEAVIPGSGITRRGMWYCAAANCRFQGLAAAIMHEAMWRLAVAAYVTGELGDTHPAVFVHDAFVLETPIATLHDVDLVFDRILREAAEHVMPEVRTKSEGHAAGSLAKRVRGQKVGRTIDDRGRLTIWTPRAA
jgi:DNA polymerase I-like protein with 3'-5' exonuclease and polymerase domains